MATHLGPYPRDYLAWCFDGADPELSAAMKEKHYELMEEQQAYYEEVLAAYYDDLAPDYDAHWAWEYEPVPQYQLDTNHITDLLGVLS